ncbi:translation initiation factor IF-2-like [Lemur catta]|uniref:translation initiation factor IF-2-like n=1 Tax=Lemur catta TaxID=9447 RepID=UPI001E26DCF5|nr:translation initiation factor IF-2-like [Lemur catta]
MGALHRELGGSGPGAGGLRGSGPGAAVADADFSSSQRAFGTLVSGLLFPFLLSVPGLTAAPEVSAGRDLSGEPLPLQPPEQAPRPARPLAESAAARANRGARPSVQWERGRLRKAARSGGLGVPARRGSESSSGVGRRLAPAAQRGLARAPPARPAPPRTPPAKWALLGAADTGWEAATPPLPGTGPVAGVPAHGLAFPCEARVRGRCRPAGPGVARAVRFRDSAAPRQERAEAGPPGSRAPRERRSAEGHGRRLGRRVPCRTFPACPAWHAEASPTTSGGRESAPRSRLHPARAPSRPRAHGPSRVAVPRCGSRRTQGPSPGNEGRGARPWETPKVVTRHFTMAPNT